MHVLHLCVLGMHACVCAWAWACAGSHAATCPGRLEVCIGSMPKQARHTCMCQAVHELKLAAQCICAQTGAACTLAC